MMNQITERMWGVRLSILSPTCLIDRLLDRIEELSGVILPAQANGLSCREIPIETRLDQLGA